MSTRSTHAQSRVFVEEMKRRARRQVLGALALLFLSLTVLPVLFEKRASDHPVPNMHWDTTRPSQSPENSNTASASPPQTQVAATNTMSSQPATSEPSLKQSATPTNTPTTTSVSPTPARATKTVLTPLPNSTHEFPDNPQARKEEQAPSPLPQHSETEIKTSPKHLNSSKRSSEEAWNDRPLSAEKYKRVEQHAQKTKLQKNLSQKTTHRHTSEHTEKTSPKDIDDLLKNDSKEDKPSHTASAPSHKDASDTNSSNETFFNQFSSNENNPSHHPSKASKTNLNTSDAESSSSADSDSSDLTTSSPIHKATKKRLSDDEVSPHSSHEKTASITSSSESSQTAYILQLAALSSEESANGLKEHINALGMNAYTQRISTRQGHVVYRVRVGPYSHATAERNLHTLQHAGFNAIITPIHRHASPSHKN